jgi:transglutaminase-like putative cysteine protease
VTEDADYFGNGLTFLTLDRPHEQLKIELRAMVEVQFPEPPEPGSTPPWETVRAALGAADGTEMLGASEFTFDSPLAAPDDTIAAYAAASFTAGRPLFDAALDLNHRIYEDFTFDAAATVIATPLTEVMQLRRGVCQDFAHLEVAALRAMGLAARYVSGYIRTYGPDSGPNLAGADASHAWISVFCPGVGWVDLDPTNDLIVRDEHIVLAWGRDFGDVSPIRGVILGGGEHVIDVAVDVTPLA